jgi:hypothetical protein
VFQQFHGEVILDHDNNEGSYLFLEITFSGGRDEAGASHALASPQLLDTCTSALSVASSFLLLTQLNP